jgi:DNA anti-recombination protein RmuC
MKATVKHIVKKVTLELIYDVVDERTRELKEEIKSINSRLDQMRQEHKEDFKSVNARIDQIHTRLDQIMHMLAELRK